MKRKHLLIGAVVVAALAIVGYLVFDAVFPNDPQPVVTGVPTSSVNSIDARRTAQAQTKTASAPSGFAPVDGIQFVAYQPEVAGDSRWQQDQPLYASCTEARVTVAGGRPEATAEPTAEATAAATEEAATPGAPDLVRFGIVGEESEACYQVGEIFLGNNEFRVAVGVTRSIDAEVEIDRGNVANSLVGDVTINISEFRSDEGRRDTAIQRRWLETNRFPFATMKNVNLVGLPMRPYVEGETLTFQIVGDLTIRETTVPTTFEATARLEGDTLVVTAWADVLMSDFAFDAPDMAGFVRADNEMRIVLNLVGRPVAQ